MRWTKKEATREDPFCCVTTTLTTEAFSAGAHVATGHVLAGATVDTRVGLALIVVDITVRSTPPRGTVTLVPTERLGL